MRNPTVAALIAAAIAVAGCHRHPRPASSPPECDPLKRWCKAEAWDLPPPSAAVLAEIEEKRRLREEAERREQEEARARSEAERAAEYEALVQAAVKGRLVNKAAEERARRQDSEMLAARCRAWRDANCTYVKLPLVPSRDCARVVTIHGGGHNQATYATSHVDCSPPPAQLVCRKPKSTAPEGCFSFAP